MKVLSENNWNIDSDFDSKRYLYIANKIGSKAKTDRSKISTVRKHIERIRDKNKTK